MGVGDGGWAGVEWLLGLRWGVWLCGCGGCKGGYLCDCVIVPVGGGGVVWLLGGRGAGLCGFAFWGGEGGLWEAAWLCVWERRRGAVGGCVAVWVWGGGRLWLCGLTLGWVVGLCGCVVWCGGGGGNGYKADTPALSTISALSSPPPTTLFEGQTLRALTNEGNDAS